MTPEIVKRAMTETVTNNRLLSKEDIKMLNKYVKKGWLSKGRGGCFPRLKTVWACPGFDFMADRQEAIKELLAL